MKNISLQKQFDTNYEQGFKTGASPTLRFSINSQEGSQKSAKAILIENKFKNSIKQSVPGFEATVSESDNYIGEEEKPNFREKNIKKPQKHQRPKADIENLKNIKS